MEYKIKQAPEVSADVMKLLEQKAQIANDVSILFTELKERKAALQEIMDKEKAFNESFIGNAEWLKKILELREQYHFEQKKYDDLTTRKGEVEQEMFKQKQAMDSLGVVVNNAKKQKEVLEDDIRKLEGEHSKINNELARENSEMAKLILDINQFKIERSELNEYINKRKEELAKRETEISQKSLNLKVYEDRIIREYAILFPGVNVKS